MDENLGFDLRRINNLLKRHMERSPAKEKMEHVTGLHGWMIGYLYCNREQDIFQRDLEKNFQIRRSTATAILQLMEKNELISKQSVPYDARLKKLCLTEKAISLHEAFEKDLSNMEKQLVRGIDASEQKHFHQTLKKMIKNMEEIETSPRQGGKENT